ncbi:methyltransferase domain-containing protein [Pseudoclavibacter endophyticus]|uniref:Methyltransferase domain-containing protein n=2 Tax=Pseudoclavibacter endophyticus TaxID=1778590 RepID=A0A6H9WHR1_9MICO|nr:methyltransferase domain-containing protein [Pseudoclavibacter endophyticus]
MRAAPAGGYVHGHHGSVLASHSARTAENSCGYLLDHLTPGMRVLDVGCGPGSITLDLAELVGPGGEVVGVDAAATAIAAARDAATLRADDRTRFEVGDVYELAHPAASFDVVHAHQVLQHLGDPIAALREMSRVTRPGGVIAARDADYGTMAWYPRLPALDRWLALYELLARENGGEPDAARHLRAWARAAGLRDVSLTATPWVYATPELAAWWGHSWADRAVSSAFATQALAGGHATREELVGIRDGWLEFAEHPDAWFSMLHGELLARA